MCYKLWWPEHELYMSVISQIVLELSSYVELWLLGLWSFSVTGSGSDSPSPPSSSSLMETSLYFWSGLLFSIYTHHQASPFKKQLIKIETKYSKIYIS